jgi:hypothetical protein
MRSNGQAFKPGGQDPVATPASSRRLSELRGVSAQSAVVADRSLDHSALDVGR